MDEYREQLDAVDAQIVELLGRRFELSRAIGEYKRQNHLEVYAPSRERELEVRIKRLAAQHNVDPELCHQIYQMIIRYSRAAQK